MFFEAPEGETKCLRFVYMPSEIEHDNTKWKDEWNEDGFRYSGTVVVPVKTKLEVERLIASILKIKKLEIQLETDIGTCIEKELEQLHDKQMCSTHCRCKFETERYWGHYIYHLILNAYAKLKNVEKKYIINPLISDKYEAPTSYLGKYEWHEKRKISSYEGSVDFVMGTILGSMALEHFKIGNVNEMGKAHLQNEQPFEMCKKGKCEYKCGEPIKIWKSKSQTNIPDPNYGVIKKWEKTHLRNTNNPKIFSKSMATIEKLSCICTSRKYYYRLKKNSLVAKKIVGKKNKELWNNYDYNERFIDEDIRNDEDIIHELLTIFYEEVIPKKQANIAAKMILNRIIEGNTERQAKFALKEKITALEKINLYWPDLAELKKQFNRH